MKKLIMYAGVLLVLGGIPLLFVDNTKGSELPLLVGLFILLAANNTKEDERAVTVKATSTYIALIIGYAMNLLVSNLYFHGFIPIEINEVNSLTF